MSIQESIDNVRKFREEWSELNDTDPDQIYAVNGAPLRPDDLDVVLAVAQTAIQSPTLMGESIQRSCRTGRMSTGARSRSSTA